MRKLRDLNGRFRMNRRAVSPVISVLLMVAVAVAAAILVYVWGMGLIGTLQTGGGSQTREQIELDAYNWKTADLVLYLRNVGASNVVVDAVYMAGEQATAGAGTILTVQGPVVAVTVSPPGPITLVDGVAYTIKVVTLSGGVFTFSCIYGRGA